MVQRDRRLAALLFVFGCAFVALSIPVSRQDRYASFILPLTTILATFWIDAPLLARFATPFKVAVGFALTIQLAGGLVAMFVTHPESDLPPAVVRRMGGIPRESVELSDELAIQMIGSSGERAVLRGTDLVLDGSP